MPIHECDGCDAPPGIRPDSTNHTSLTIPPTHTVIERCDLCALYPDDLAAAQHYGSGAAEWADDQGRTVVVARTRKDLHAS
jgi:hypothetical protein